MYNSLDEMVDDYEIVGAKMFANRLKIKTSAAYKNAVNILNQAGMTEYI